MEYLLLGELQVKKVMSYDFKIFHMWKQRMAYQNGVGNFLFGLVFKSLNCFKELWKEKNNKYYFVDFVR